ncbi:MAG: hypothetical protein KF862_27330 [Chitinophagaceae bacterium]|nr:hypothetical protein [Chitinophagaceae bacterium]
MQKLKLSPLKIIPVLLAVIVSFSCSKDDNNNNEDNDDDKKTASEKMVAIVTQAHLDKVKTMDFTVYTGNNASAYEIGGKYLVAPLKHDASSYSETLSSVNADGFTLTIMTDQNGGGLFVSMSSEGNAPYNLSDPVIVGSGNNFTICRHRDMLGVAYAQLISGTKDGNALKNVKLATIKLSNGDINIYSDEDGTSPQQP